MKRLRAGLFVTLFAAALAGCSKPSPSPTATPTASNSAPAAGQVNAMNKTPTSPNTPTPPAGKVELTDAQWKEKLTPEQYRILREKGTERAFTGKYWNTHTPGVYHCAACGAELFRSDAKFDSGCGWPSFNQPIDGKVGGSGQTIIEYHDSAYGMDRTEVVCAKCGGHLGHVFSDAPDQPTGLRYCINSGSIELEEKK